MRNITCLQAVAHDLMIKLLKSKIDEFMAGTNRIEWLPDEPARTANDYIQETLLFLDTTLGVAVDVLPLDAFEKVKLFPE